jgi:hypothetical protein
MERSITVVETGSSTPMAQRGHGHVQRFHQRRVRGVVHHRLHALGQQLHALLDRRAQHRRELGGDARMLQGPLRVFQRGEVFLGEVHP